MIFFEFFFILPFLFTNKVTGTFVPKVPVTQLTLLSNHHLQYIDIVIIFFIFIDNNIIRVFVIRFLFINDIFF